ncbi:MAG TPA: bifunctional tetrahydrofolate synthase/dihydrofolate synthase [Candidatus Binatia bacterium]|nr:bifunctional tetrahydrofolate synthase/dihydrofolate synthase [Candidatus Binatia bacterium]
MTRSLPHSAWSLADWLAYQEALHPKSIALGLERVAQVAHRLGLPERRIRTLTVAGTNGKGSSATLAAGIYRAAGYRVGLYTSPHLLRYNDRIAIDSVPASDELLCRAFAAVEQARGDTLLTYFEFGTLAALWLFREARVEVQVLEVGLGGRLDAVNLVDADAMLITNIGLDHTDWLGPDRESIGREKAGILRAGRPAVLVERAPPASIAAAGAALGVELTQLGREFDFEPRAQDWRWHGGGQELDALPKPGLAGAVQMQNASGVIAAVNALQPLLPVQPEAIRAALPLLRLPGRFQREGRLILDVAHNTEAAAVLADNLRALLPSGRIWLVLGMLADKPVESFARQLAPLVHHAFLAGLPGPRGLSAGELAARSREVGWDAEQCGDVAEALARARAQADDQDWIVVTGSFLTVAAAAEQT